MDKQQAVAEATAIIANSVRTLSADMARKADQDRKQAREKAEQELQTNNPELWQDYNQLSEDKKQLVLRETSKDYRAADEQAQSWGIGGNKSRALNAVTSAVTGILGGQTSLQAATNALAPYAAELIGKQFGHGDNKNQAAQLVAHALLGAITASVNGGNALAGAAGASAAELAAQYLIKQLPKDQYPEAIDPKTGEIDPNRLPESVKANIRDLSSAVATVSGGITGGSLVNAQIAGVVGQNAVENNALINSKGESKLNAQERKINEKLKKAGVQNADDYQRKYDACKTEACRQQVKKDYIEATEQASKIILELYRSGQLSTEESMILLTSYASKMMQGAGESQDGSSTPIFNMDAQRWTPSGVIANPDFQQITLSNLVQKMKQSGASEQQIAMRILQYQIAGQAIGSYSMVEQVDALYHSGVSLNTVINAIALKRGKPLSINEIKAITSRYNNNSGSLVTADGQVIKNNGHQSTASESRGAQQSGGKGKTETAEKESGKGSSLPVPESIKAKNGLDYESNPKHTKGQVGNRPNAGIEPKNSLELFEHSIPSTKQYPNKEVRFAVDKEGNIHRFEGTNGKYHWNGSSGDSSNPLKGKQIPNDIQKKLGVKIK